MSAGEEHSEVDRREAHHEVLVRLLPPLVHRLNNSLAVIHGTLELSGGRIDAERIDRARREARRIGRTLARLGSYAKERRRSPGAFDLLAILGDVELLLSPLAESRGVELALRCPFASVHLRGDEGGFGRLILTLVGAAILAGGSPASKGGRGRGRHRLRVSLAGLAGRLRLRLAFDAPPPAIFVEGTHLRREAELLASAAEASLRLRARAAPATAIQLSFARSIVEVVERREREQPGGTPARVLLVEPAAELGELVEAVLSDRGLRVRVVRDGRSARHELEKSTFELVLFDAELEGWEPGTLAELMAARGARHLALLGDSSAGGVPASIPALAKPFRPHELLAFVEGRLR